MSLIHDLNGGLTLDDRVNLEKGWRAMITARDVARELGISVSTVGRVLTDDPRISEKTKAEVRRVADRLGYVGSNPARIMRGSSSNLIGLMIPDVANDFYAAIAQALSECLEGRGHRVVLSLTRDDRDVEARHIRELLGARAAGIILVPTSKPKRESKMLLAQVPHAQLLRHSPAFGNMWFGMDDEPAIREATSTLVCHGHHRIAYIGGSGALSTGAARVQGYRAALADASIPLDPQLEILGDPVNLTGLQGMHRLLALSDPPTAIVTGSVHITIGLIQAVEQSGITVPGDLSVIGFGDPAWFSWWRGGMSTVHPPVRDLATACGLWFLNNLDRKGDDPAQKAHQSIIASRLLMRGSVGPPKQP